MPELIDPTVRLRASFLGRFVDMAGHKRRYWVPTSGPDVAPCLGPR